MCDPVGAISGSDVDVSNVLSKFACIARDRHAYFQNATIAISRTNFTPRADATFNVNSISIRLLNPHLLCDVDAVSPWHWVVRDCGAVTAFRGLRILCKAGIRTSHVAMWHRRPVRCVFVFAEDANTVLEGTESRKAAKTIGRAFLTNISVLRFNYRP